MTAELYLKERAALVDHLLDQVAPRADARPTRLHRAMRHLLFPGGKRLRPALAFAACEAVGGAPERALPVAAAVELVHTYSLVHDDLPCMDDDALRRGRPTVHVAFDEATAVLAGDALLALAFQVLSDAPDLESELRIRSVAELAAAAGSLGLVGGQSDDLRFDVEGAHEAERVESVHRRKSAALIAAAVAAGARSGGADEALVSRLRYFGGALGVAFQIADDLLDRGESEPCSSVRVLGEERARRRAEELLGEGLAKIEALDERAEPLRALARYAVRRDQ